MGRTHGRTDGTVGPLERGLEVIELLGRSPARPADLARAAGLARSTVDRVISTLEQSGYVRLRDREVALAPRLMELGNAYLAAAGIVPAAAREVALLAESLDESVSLAVADRAGVRFVAQSPRRRSMSVSFRVGDLLPAERCAPGAVFAADWGPREWERWRGRAEDETRFALPMNAFPEVEELLRARTAAYLRDGWAEDDQLIEPGLIAIALPVRDASGSPVSVLSVVSHTSRHDVDSLRAHALPKLAACAARIEQAQASPRRPARPAGLDLSREAKHELGADYLQSLHRGLAVMAALDAPAGLTLSETAAATGLPRATARRSLLTLTALGYAAENDGRFLLLPRVLDLGYSSLSGLGLPEIARSHLRALSASVGDSVSLAVLDGTDIRYVARSPASKIMQEAVEIGTRLPAYATSMGRILLAGLAEPDAARILEHSVLRPFTAHTRTDPADLADLVASARLDGYALVDQELEEGLRSLAVPVRDRAGRVIAALNTACHAAAETPAASRARLLPPLRAAAAALETDLSMFLTR
ncbi:IclR family transcriptional regulator domain-containing protein [Actinocorallia libanotica]|uniref:IclR family transcriptional regulator C-terminal domain-containing protein n=1 Tax=Actinocorallia libanotica TaxID=46162 RepID=A0ABN1RCA8_9ACTN